jgi:hypothetical protein
MKITNKWLNSTDVINFRVTDSGSSGPGGGADLIDSGTIPYDETYEVPKDKFDKFPNTTSYRLTATARGDDVFVVSTLTRRSDVLISVTNTTDTRK